MLTIPSHSAAGLGGATAVGTADLAFFPPGSGFTLAAAGQGGQVFLWDARARATPAATLQSRHGGGGCGGGAVRGLQLAAGGHAVIAGTEAGEVGW